MILKSGQESIGVEFNKTEEKVNINIESSASHGWENLSVTLSNESVRKLATHILEVTK